MIRTPKLTSIAANATLSRRHVLRLGAATAAAVTGTAMVTDDAEAARGTRIARAALRRRGKGYSYLGTGPQRYGCSGLVYVAVLEGAGKDLSVDLVRQYHSSRPVRRKRIRKGDLVFFKGTQGRMKGPTHVGIAISRTKMVHAANRKSGVTVDSISTYRKHFLGVRRVR